MCACVCARAFVSLVHLPPTDCTDYNSVCAWRRSLAIRTPHTPTGLGLAHWPRYPRSGKEARCRTPPCCLPPPRPSPTSTMSSRRSWRDAFWRRLRPSARYTFPFLLQCLIGWLDSDFLCFLFLQNIAQHGTAHSTARQSTQHSTAQHTAWHGTAHSMVPCAVPCYALCCVLCCAVLCCAVLCCVLCCAVLCCAVLCCAVLCCAVLCCAMLCAVLCCVLCCAVPCCVL